MDHPTHILYLHGFRSSPKSLKAVATRGAVLAFAPDTTWLCPALPPSPQLAMAQVMHSIQGWPKESMAVIGSSLGGFYATWVAERVGCKAVLLNPAIRPDRDLAAHIGKHPMWHAPEEHFYFEPSFVGELEQQKLPHITRPDRYFAVIAKGDEVLDWREMTAFYAGAQIKLLPGGDHALSDYVDAHLSEVLDFLFPRK